MAKAAYKRKPKGYWCHPGMDLEGKFKHKWHYGVYPTDSKYVCSNCGMQRNKISNLSDKEK